MIEEKLDYTWINLGAGFSKKDGTAFEDEDMDELMAALREWAEERGLKFVGGMVFATDEA